MSIHEPCVHPVSCSQNRPWAVLTVTESPDHSALRMPRSLPTFTCWLLARLKQMQPPLTFGLSPPLLFSTPSIPPYPSLALVQPHPLFQASLTSWLVHCSPPQWPLPEGRGLPLGPAAHLLLKALNSILNDWLTEWILGSSYVVPFWNVLSFKVGERSY